MNIELKQDKSTARNGWYGEKGSSASQWIPKVQPWIEGYSRVFRVSTLVNPSLKNNRLPSDLRYLSDAINSSFSILKLEKDCNEEGIPVYKKSTLDRAIKFLENHALWLWKNHGICIDAPKILPGPSGSIDLWWAKDSYELLVNIPEDPCEPANFYGDDKGKIHIKGTFNPDVCNQGLLIWLQEKK